jgi:CelD/BcsL family acetyltransferase involved in cellulose biosynthesis
LAPLYRSSVAGPGGVGLTELRLIGDGSGDSDYLEILARRGSEDLVARRLLEYLAERGELWDLLRLNEVPAGSPMLGVLRSLWKQRWYYWSQEEVTCAEIRLPGSWDRYLDALAPRMRTKIRSITRRLDAGFSVKLEVCDGIDALGVRLESLFDLHGQRWAVEGQRGVFVWPGKREFYRHMARLFLDRDWLRLYSLTVDGRYVAHQFCFEYGDRAYLLQEGMDPAWMEHQVGNVLRARVLRDCIERGLEYYDFLGGTGPHKRSWGATEKASVRVTAGTRRLRSRLYFGARRAAASGKRVASRVFPEPVLEALRAWRRHKARAEPRSLAWSLR